MAKLTNTSGNLYFLKEKDYITGEVSPYVKIGLVRKEKETAQRILEHQTGNPRFIYDYQSLAARFVEDLETQMHYRLADKWITGEWFILTNAELKKAIVLAKKVIKEQQEIADVLLESYDLSKVEATKELRDPTKKENALWQQLIDKKLDVDINKTQSDTVAGNIKTALGNAGEIPGIVTIQLKEGRDSFNESDFKQSNPDLYMEYCTKKSEAISGSFTLLNKKSVRKDAPDIYEAKAAAMPKTKLDADEIDMACSIKRSKSLERLHAEYIQFQQKAAILQWEYAQLEAKLKHHTGIHKGITGICGWNRVIKEKISFDKAEFKSQHPELYDEFVVEGKMNYAVLINANRPYAF